MTAAKTTAAVHSSLRHPSYDATNAPSVAAQDRAVVRGLKSEIGELKRKMAREFFTATREEREADQVKLDSLRETLAMWG